MSISCVDVLEGKLSAHETAFAVLFSSFGEDVPQPKFGDCMELVTPI